MSGPIYGSFSDFALSAKHSCRRAESRYIPFDNHVSLVTSNKNMQQTEKYWNLINRIVVVAIIFMAGTGVVLAFAPKVKELKENQETYDGLQKSIDTTVSAENELKSKQRRFTTDRVFVERIAHEVGYARKDEVIFHFPEESGGH